MAGSARQTVHFDIYILELINERNMNINKRGNFTFIAQKCKQLTSIIPDQQQEKYTNNTQNTNIFATWNNFYRR